MSLQSALSAMLTAFRAFTALGGVIFCTVCFAEGLLHFLDRVFSQQEAQA